MDLLLILLIIGIPALAQISITNSYNEYKSIKNGNGLQGKDIARKILDENNLKEISIEETNGNLTDHYDPSAKVIRLSSDIFNGTSIASAAVAAHECGHAIQDKVGYSFLKFRTIIYPIVNVATSISYWIILLGFLFELLDLIYVGIALTCFGLVFQIITLPVEFDASSRAEKLLNNYQLVTTDEELGVKKVLGAAAMTYVAGVLSSSLQILRLLLMTQRRN